MHNEMAQLMSQRKPQLVFRLSSVDKNERREVLIAMLAESVDQIGAKVICNDHNSGALNHSGYIGNRPAWQGPKLPNILGDVLNTTVRVLWIAVGRERTLCFNGRRTKQD